jgi:hypothetical protein
MDVFQAEDTEWGHQAVRDAEIHSEGKWLVFGVALFFFVSICFAGHGYFRRANVNMIQVAVSGMMAMVSGLLLVGVDLSKANSTHTKYIISLFVLGILSCIVMLFTCYLSVNPEATALLIGTGLMVVLTCILAIHVGLEDPSENAGIKDSFMLAVFFAMLFSVGCGYTSVSFLDAKVESWRPAVCTILLLLSVLFFSEGLLAFGFVSILGASAVPVQFYWSIYEFSEEDKKIELKYRKISANSEDGVHYQGDSIEDNETAQEGQMEISNRSAGEA